MDATSNGKNEPTIKLSWDYEPVTYERFTDLGNYLIQFNDVDFSDFDTANKIINATRDTFPKPACTATIKVNRKGEVIVGRNMDVEISQNPAYITKVHGGKYETIAFNYSGSSGKYRYDQCSESDADQDFCTITPYLSTDAMNEAGLYVEANMREMDSAYNLYCSGTNPGKQRACLLSSPVLTALNCATVPEAVEFLNDSYDWYTLGFNHGGNSDEKFLWNLALLMGDAQGNYGLVEFAQNKVCYTPYANGQGNYYIHPAIAEYAVEGTGYGRLATALEGLPACQTEQDMMRNMETCMWKREILDPGCLGFSDYLSNVNDRRANTQEQMLKDFVNKLAPAKPLAEAFYAGDEKPLRESGAVWTTGFNFGVNCTTKHLILRLWENSNVIVDIQW